MRLFSASLLLISSIAFALPSPKDVERAVVSGDLPTAELLLKQILREKPDSARAHYNLAQVYNMQSKYELALMELNKSQAIDPSLKFAASRSKFNSVRNEINASLSSERIVTREYQAPRPVVVAPPPKPLTPAELKQMEESRSRAVTFITSFLLLLIASIAGFFGVRIYLDRQLTKKLEAEKKLKYERELNESKEVVVRLSEKVRRITKLVDLSSHYAPAKASMLSELGRIKSIISNGLSMNNSNQVANIPPNLEVDLDRIEASAIKTPEQHSNDLQAELDAAIVKREYEERHKKAREESDRLESVQRKDEETRKLREQTRRTPTPAPVHRMSSPSVHHHHHHSNSNNNGSSLGDLVAGIALGSLLSSDKSEAGSPSPSRFDSGNDDPTPSKRSSGYDSGYDSGGSSSGYDSGSSSSRSDSSSSSSSSSSDSGW